MLSPALVTCEVAVSTQAGFASDQLKAPGDSSSRTCFPAVWAATDSGSRSGSSSETPKSKFSKQEVDFRQLERPFETVPKTTRDFTSTKSRLARIPSRVMRLRRLIRLSRSRRLTCLPPKNHQENNVVHFNFRESGAAAARTSCMLLGGSSHFQSMRTCSPLSPANSFQASQSSRAMDAKQPPAPLGEASVA